MTIYQLFPYFLTNLGEIQHRRVPTQRHAVRFAHISPHEFSQKFADWLWV